MPVENKILLVENKILPILLLKLKLTKTHNYFFTHFAKNTAVVFLLVVKMAAPHREGVQALVYTILGFKQIFGGILYNV